MPRQPRRDGPDEQRPGDHDAGYDQHERAPDESDGPLRLLPVAGRPRREGEQRQGKDQRSDPQRRRLTHRRPAAHTQRRDVEPTQRRHRGGHGHERCEDEDERDDAGPGPQVVGEEAGPLGWVERQTGDGGLQRGEEPPAGDGADEAHEPTLHGGHAAGLGGRGADESQRGQPLLTLRRGQAGCGGDEHRDRHQERERADHHEDLARLARRRLGSEALERVDDADWDADWDLVPDRVADVDRWTAPEHRGVGADDDEQLVGGFEPLVADDHRDLP